MTQLPPTCYQMIYVAPISINQEKHPSTDAQVRKTDKIMEGLCNADQKWGSETTDNKTKVKAKGKDAVILNIFSLLPATSNSGNVQAEHALMCSMHFVIDVGFCSDFN